ncbi:PREDICTED: structure-specific endonuclease subunit SLX4 isoform X2 [Rhagoletis zephyria]|uniref:structure-specific endonuclease subunit SLX4 isoform X2 n=1 Tax=Rhagoletis zephyria TaxID=28612 RepID=UPI000811390E|nr:PREDICTED: structure-specific endonuclease subunit SLX4 isoform X2 [Rhagoletis zephyria]
MDREIRKANLKKLRLSGIKHIGKSGEQNLRKTRSVHPTISKYFTTPISNELKHTLSYKEMNNDCVNKLSTADETSCSKVYNSEEVINPKSRKRINLTDFVLKESKNVEKGGEIFKFNNKDAVEIPQKKVKKPKKLPYSKKSAKFSILRGANQKDIKTSLLRSEHAFTEIASQHCRVDSFSTDEIVLALALSKSEIENSGPICLDPGESDADLDDHDELKNIPKILQEYGFRTNSLEDYKNLASAIAPGVNRRKRTKWANKFTALTLRDYHLQTSKVESKIHFLIAQQINWNEGDAYENEVGAYSLISGELEEAANTVINRVETKEKCNMEEFYVKSLFEVGCAQAGCLLKDWHALQGRDKSPEGRVKNQAVNADRQMNLIYMKLEDDFGLKEKSKPSPHKNDTLQNERKNGTSEVDIKCSSTLNNDEQLVSLSSEISESYIKNEKLLKHNIEYHSCNEPSERLNANSDESCIGIELFKHISEECELNPSSTLQNDSQNFHGISNRTRNLSPNIFASSDDECEDVSSKNPGTGSHQQEFNVQNEVSTDIENSYNAEFLENNGLAVTSKLMDLTQEVFSEQSDKSTEKQPPVFNDFASKRIETLSTSEKKAPISLDGLALKATDTKVNTPMLNLMKCPSFPPITNQMQSLTCTNTEPSISIAPNEEIDDCENCIVLSDDEINYSIWKADMSRARDEAKCVNTISEIGNSRKEYENSKNFSIFDFMEGVEYMANNTKRKSTSNINSFTYDVDREGFHVPFSSKLSDRSKELLEFDILDNTSELHTYTPKILKTSQGANINENLTPSQNVPVGLGELLTADMRFKKLNEEISSTNMLSHATLLNVAEYTPDEYEIAGRIYTTRIVTGPKPDFDQQNEAEILKQLYGFGIKPLKRKQAVKILEYIYNSTHPVVLAQTIELSFSSKNENTSSDAINVELDGHIVRATSHIVSSRNKLQLSDCLCLNMLHCTKELLMTLEYEDYVFQTNVTKKTPRPLLPLHIAWYNLVISSTILHEMILRYKPIDLHNIYVFFKQIGYRFEPKDMKAFLDRRCIVFRYDMTHPSRQSERHISKSKSKDKKKSLET